MDKHTIPKNHERSEEDCELEEAEATHYSAELALTYLKELNFGDDSEFVEEYFYDLNDIFLEISGLGEEETRKFVSNLLKLKLHPDLLKDRFDLWAKNDDGSILSRKKLREMIIKPTKQLLS